MLRRLVLAVVGLSMSTVAFTTEVDVVELGTTPFVGGSPAVTPALLPAVPAAGVVPTLHLVWLDPASAATGAEAQVQPEVARLLRSMGVKTTWRRGEPHELARPGELRVIFLDRGAERAHHPVLGATPASFEGERFVWVHVPSVRAATGLSTRGSGLNLDFHAARRLGVALARVIAHEVVHALAPQVPHGSGLMAARLNRATLTAATIRIDPQVGLAARAALGAGPSAPRPAEAILAVESSYEEPYR